jgi:uncharacterized protein YcnI
MPQYVNPSARSGSDPQRRSDAGSGAAQRALRGLVLLGVSAAVMLVPVAASAHVTVQPSEVPGGGFSVVDFRVPNERDDATTIKVQVLLPKDQPIGSVSTTPVPGWKATTTTRTLDNPIDLFGEKVSKVVSKVTWTSTGKGVGVHEFQDFPLSLGPLPDSGELVFIALQTYSSGEEVAWNEVAAAGGPEPEHPAPVLTLVPGSASEDPTASATSGAESAAAADATAPVAANAGSDSGRAAVGLSAAALVVALAALVLAWRRGRS